MVVEATADSRTSWREARRVGTGRREGAGAPLTTLANECAESVEVCSTLLPSHSAALIARLDSAVIEEAMMVAPRRYCCHMGQAGVSAVWGPPQFTQRTVWQGEPAAWLLLQVMQPIGHLQDSTT